MSELVFKDPPGGKHHGKWTQYLEPLQANPGKWALLGEFPRHQGNSGGNSLRRIGLEVRTHGLSDGVVEIYARWPEQNGNGS